MFQGKYYEQVEVTAMGFTFSPIVANLHMEFFEDKTLRTSQNPPRNWKRFMGGTFVIQCTEHNDNLLEHIYSIDRAIKFTVEDTRTDGLMSFLDPLVIPVHNGTLSTRIYRKPTHIDQYLQWDSHHHIGVKNSVTNTLSHRAQTVSSTAEHHRTQVEHIKEVLTKCKYPTWALQ